MIKIAVFTYYGLDRGGTEKFLQTVAALLPKNRYTVDFYYIDNVPQKVSQVKKEYLIKNNVNLIPYHCEKVEVKKRYVYQINSTFFEVFQGADIILTGSSGFTEQILEKIKKYLSYKQYIMLMEQTINITYLEYYIFQNSVKICG